MVNGPTLKGLTAEKLWPSLIAFGRDTPVPTCANAVAGIGEPIKGAGEPTGLVEEA